MNITNNSRFFAKSCSLAMLMWMSAHAANEPLNFDFLREQPGKRIFIDPHSLHINCRGSGDTTVVFEAGLGGSALEWSPVVDILGPTVLTCVYDRAGYGWSDASPYAANVSRLAYEANELLNAADIQGPLILVGHSFGGLVIRQIADLKIDNVVGMVLVDASHEDQLQRFEELGGASLVPTGDNFIMRISGVPENLPDEISRNIDALSRLRKTYDATHGEMSNFRLSTEQIKSDRKVFPFPIKVMSRGISPYAENEQGKKKTAIWNELQEDLTNLSTQGELIVAEKSGHHIHIDEPELVKQAIMELLYENKKNQIK